MRTTALYHCQCPASVLPVSCPNYSTSPLWPAPYPYPHLLFTHPHLPLANGQTQGIDPRQGLPKLRSEWVARRASDSNPTQMAYARKGVVTEEMAFVAAREGLDPEFVRSEVRPHLDPLLE